MTQASPGPNSSPGGGIGDAQAARNDAEEFVPPGPKAMRQAPALQAQTPQSRSPRGAEVAIGGALRVAGQKALRRGRSDRGDDLAEGGQAFHRRPLRSARSRQRRASSAPGSARRRRRRWPYRPPPGPPPDRSAGVPTLAAWRAAPEGGRNQVVEPLLTSLPQRLPSPSLGHGDSRCRGRRCRCS